MSMITVQGHLRVPASIRHRVGLVAGDRVLLTADPGRNQLVVHPPAVLDDLLAARHAALSGGDL
ncbi:MULTISPECIES: AbrB/MazE/SpoVT family DNA-binding domain-containing protein [Actinoalloteichus]|uniref:AbrB/MazE/SpoVT family DNA-binding domain-containing protein n=1 Tax=Actinoalloteichus TaxID=65496 RepID=UPI001E2ACB92|nr:MULTISPECIES: AbrB/MazE/SpoVT family DNA-binding domain-containing protein [Actinoalloteichus]